MPKANEDVIEIVDDVEEIVDVQEDAEDAEEMEGGQGERIRLPVLKGSDGAVLRQSNKFSSIRDQWSEITISLGENKAVVFTQSGKGEAKLKKVFKVAVSALTLALFSGKSTSGDGAVLWLQSNADTLKFLENFKVEFTPRKRAGAAKYTGYWKEYMEHVKAQAVWLRRSVEQFPLPHQTALPVKEEDGALDLRSWLEPTTDDPQ